MSTQGSLALALAFALAALGCSSASPTDAGGADAATIDVATTDTGPPSTDTGNDVLAFDVGEPDAAMPSDAGGAAPITAPAETWTWVDFPGARCDDGSATGLGVNLTSASDDVLVFFNGGGACWDYLTCVTLNTSAHGPFGAAQFAAVTTAIGSAPIFDRTNAANPFRDFTFVFVPYCTGDLHGGSHVATYTDAGGATATLHHVGRTNVEVFLPRLVATRGAPGRVVAVGSSTGGYGAVLNHALLRASWPSAEGFVVDDSGPLLPDAAIPPAIRAAWDDAWHLDTLVDPLCGPACETDLSAFHTAMATALPDDRLALLSSTRDAVVRSYLMLTDTAFETALDALVTTRFTPTDDLRALRVTGTSHALLGSADGTMLGWLGDMLDDPAWANVGP